MLCVLLLSALLMGLVASDLVAVVEPATLLTPLLHPLCQTNPSVPATLPGTRRLSMIKDDDGAWTSPSSPTAITLDFPAPVTASRIAITFQGGFVATSLVVSADEVLGKVYPEDVNRRQVFE